MSLTAIGGHGDRQDSGGEGEADGKDASQVSGSYSWMGWYCHLLGWGDNPPSTGRGDNQVWGLSVEGL